MSSNGLINNYMHSNELNTIYADSYNGINSKYLLLCDGLTSNIQQQINNLTIGTGVVGPVGPIGPPGTNGTNGTNGSQGPSGTNGTNGTNGTIGLTGLTGPSGTNGTNGLTGPIGPPGTNGTNGTNGLIGLTGPSGTNGTNGLIGLTGPSGTNAINPTFTAGKITTATTTPTFSLTTISPNNYSLDFGLVSGINGTNGYNGITPCFSIHSVSTGSNSAVSISSNAATPYNYWFDFTLVQGPQGPQGSKGDTGADAGTIAAALGISLANLLISGIGFATVGLLLSGMATNLTLLNTDVASLDYRTQYMSATIGVDGTAETNPISGESDGGIYTLFTSDVKINPSTLFGTNRESALEFWVNGSIIQNRGNTSLTEVVVGKTLTCVGTLTSMGTTVFGPDYTEANLVINARGGINQYSGTNTLKQTTITGGLSTDNITQSALMTGNNVLQSTQISTLTVIGALNLNNDLKIGSGGEIILNNIAGINVFEVSFDGYISQLITTGTQYNILQNTQMSNLTLQGTITQSSNIFNNTLSPTTFLGNITQGYSAMIANTLQNTTITRGLTVDTITLSGNITQSGGTTKLLTTSITGGLTTDTLQITNNITQTGGTTKLLTTGINGGLTTDTLNTSGLANINSLQTGAATVSSLTCSSYVLDANGLHTTNMLGDINIGNLNALSVIADTNTVNISAITSISLNAPLIYLNG